MIAKIKYTLLFVLCLLMLPLNTHAEDFKAKNSKFVVVIDPGHGGENLGSIEGAIVEKEMDMVTALAMYETLSKFDNVEVYLTRTEDEDISLKDRAKFAKEKKADVLFCIHYNASVNHDLFGSEVWVSSKAPYNQYGFQFAYELLSDFQEKGLYIRGIKTRLNDKGTDYYGILRESVALDTLAILIEHCHIDEATDIPFCTTEDQLKQFGYDDALAAAKFLHLKSSELGIDFSAYQLKNIDPASQPIRTTLKDYTEPDYCTVELLECDYNTGHVKVQVTGLDSESPLMYYAYSLDGGKTFSPLQVWPGSDTLTGVYDTEFTLELQIPSGVHPAIVVEAHNQFDLVTVSNAIATEKSFLYQTEAEETVIQATAPVETTMAENTDKADNNRVLSVDRTKFYFIILISVVSVVFLFVLSVLVYRLKNKE